MAKRRARIELEWTLVALTIAEPRPTDLIRVFSRPSSAEPQHRSDDMH